MAQVVQRGLQRRLFDAIANLGDQGRNFSKRVGIDDAYNVALQRATQELDQDAKIFQMRTEDRARGIKFEQEDRERQRIFDQLKELSEGLGIQSQRFSLAQQQAGAKQDARNEQALAEADPYELFANAVPPEVMPAVERARGIYSKLSGEARGRWLKDSTQAIDKAVDTYSRQKFKEGLADRVSRGAYGEDEQVADSLKGLEQLVDSGAPMQDVAKADIQLRSGMAKSNAAIAKKERVLAFIQQQAATLPPGPQADRAEQVAAAYQAELIDERGAAAAMAEIQYGEQAKPKAPKSLPELYGDAVELSRKLYGSDARPEQVIQGAEQIFQRLQDQQQGGGATPFGLDPLGPLNTSAGKAEAAGLQSRTGSPSAGTPQPAPSTGGGPAAPVTPEVTMQNVARAMALMQLRRIKAAGGDWESEAKKLGIDLDEPIEVVPGKGGGESVTDKPKKRKRIVSDDPMTTPQLK